MVSVRRCGPALDPTPCLDLARERAPQDAADSVEVARAHELRARTAELREDTRAVAVEVCHGAVRDAEAARGELDAILSDPARRAALLGLLGEARALAERERALSVLVDVGADAPRSFPLRERAEAAGQRAAVRELLTQISAASPVFSLLVPALADTELTVEGVRAALDARVLEVRHGAESTIRDLEEGRLDPIKLSGALAMALEARAQSRPRDPEVLEAATDVGDGGIGVPMTVLGVATALSGGTALLIFTGFASGYGLVDSAFAAREAAQLAAAEKAALDPRRPLVRDGEAEAAATRAAVTLAFTLLDLRAARQALARPVEGLASATAAAKAASPALATSADPLLARAVQQLGGVDAMRLFARFAGRPPARIAALIEGGEAAFAARAVEAWGAQAGRRLGDVGPETVRNLRHALDAGDEAVLEVIARRPGGGLQAHLYGAIKEPGLAQGSLSRLLEVMGDESLEALAKAHGPRGLRRLLDVVHELSALPAQQARALLPHLVDIGESVEGLVGQLSRARADSLLEVEQRAVRAADEAAEAARKGAPSAASKAKKAAEVRQWADRMHQVLPTIALPTAVEVSRRIAAVVARAADPLREAACAAQLLAHDVVERAHAVLRHGAQVTEAQQVRRVKEGIAPDGLPSWSGVATRYKSFADMLAAREAAIAEAVKQAKATGKSVVTVTVDAADGVAVAGVDCVRAAAACRDAVVRGPVSKTFARVELRPDGTVKAVIQQFPDAEAAGIGYTLLP